MLSHRQSGLLRRVFGPLVWVAVFQLIFFSLLAASVSLHDAAHGHEHDGTHHCLATDLVDGALDGAVVILPSAPATRPGSGNLIPQPARLFLHLPLHLTGSLLEHGPPSLA